MSSPSIIHLDRFRVSNISVHSIGACCPAPGLIRGRSSGHNNKIKIKLVPASNFNLHMHGAGDDWCPATDNTSSVPAHLQNIFNKHLDLDTAVAARKHIYSEALKSAKWYADAFWYIHDLPAYFLFSLEQPTFQRVVNHKCHQSDILWHWFMTFMTFNIIRATIHS